MPPAKTSQKYIFDSLLHLQSYLPLVIIVAENASRAELNASGPPQSPRYCQGTGSQQGQIQGAPPQGAPEDGNL